MVQWVGMLLCEGRLLVLGGGELVWPRLRLLDYRAVTALADAACCLVVISGVSISVLMIHLIPFMPHRWRDWM